MQRERESKKKMFSYFFSNLMLEKKRREKGVSFAVKTFVVELNIWMPQASEGWNILELHNVTLTLQYLTLL